MVDNYEQLRHLSNTVMRQLDDNMQLTLINLPDVCLEAILSNLSYDEISKYRIVRDSILKSIERIFFFLYQSAKRISWYYFFGDIGLQTI